jgi:ABC-type dipeptide/oligopeptide/nickel transport system ATPase component
VSDLLTIRDLHVRFAAPGGFIRAVAGVSFRVRPRSTVALVGESGSGKSVVSQSIMRILPRNGEITRGEILFADPRGDGTAIDLARLPKDGAAMRAIRGGRISIIFQEPMTSLSPLHTVGNQVGEALRLHRPVGAADPRDPAPRRLSRPAARLAQLSVRAVGRIAAAGDDRDGAGLPPGAADRRRADDGARRHHPGADPQARARIAAGARHGGAADHP